MPKRVLTTRMTILAASAAAALGACGGPGGGPNVDAGASGGAGGEAGACSPTPDTCAPASGVTWECKKRFMYGANWAWRSFAGDFGGVSSWGVRGVSSDPGPFSDALASMKSSGVSVVRWWMFPRFVTDAIQWDADGAPAGITPSLTADIQRALALAEQHDVYIMLTPFSFDNFRPTSTENGVYSRSLKPMVVNSTLRQKLVDNLLGSIADAVAQSPYRHRLIAWDVMNEPEWAIAGASVTGDPDFPAQPGLETVSHDQMETFLSAAVDVLRQRSGGALVSVGGAAIKWAKAWSRIGLDFYQFHYYDWVYESFPYTQVTLASAGVTDKPVVMGEFPADGLSAIPSKGLPARSASEFAADLSAGGYAGALSWAYDDPSFPWNPGPVKSFAEARGCGVAY